MLLYTGIVFIGFFVLARYLHYTILTANERDKTMSIEIIIATIAIETFLFYIGKMGDHF